MDLHRFLLVAWRFRLIVLGGLLVAVLAAMLSFLRIGPDGIGYREAPVYTSAATLFVTQDGFPWGRAILDDMVTVDPGDGSDPIAVPRFGDPARYSGLASLYAELAKGDEIRREAQRGAAPGEYYTPTVAQSPGGGAALPLIYMQGFGPSPEAAKRMANRSTEAFIAFLEREQQASRIEEGKRVDVTVTQVASKAEVFQGRSYVRPIFIFLLVAMATLALAFALENLRPQRELESGDLWPEGVLRPAADPDEFQPAHERLRRTAAP